MDIEELLGLLRWLSADASEPIIPIDEISLSNTTIAENSPVGTDIGMFAATGGTGALAFELIAGAGDSGNEFFEIAGNRLRTDAVLDYESEPTHSFACEQLIKQAKRLSKHF